MAETTPIEWADATWPVITGCSVTSPGCTRCYAMRQAGGWPALARHPSRAGLTRLVNGNHVWTGEVRFNEQWLLNPLKWQKPRKIFVCPAGDLFHENVPDEWIDKIFAVMALAPQHTFQVLTKRAKRMREYLVKRTSAQLSTRGHDDNAMVEALALVVAEAVVHLGWTRDAEVHLERISPDHGNWPLPNVCLGVSVEDQQRANDRIPDLLATPAAVRWISAEPLLGPVDLRRIRIAPDHHTIIDALDGYAITDSISGSGQERAKLDWVVSGGESGTDARMAETDCFRSLRDQCTAAGVHFLHKQNGMWVNADDYVRQRKAEGYRFFESTKKVSFSHPLNFDDAARVAISQDLKYQHLANGETMIRVKKKDQAGRLLDGVIHDAYPEVR